MALKSSDTVSVVSPRRFHPQKAVGYWLLVCCLCVALMVLVGGWTRLSGSGLSMVEWKPITGWLPPLSATEWQAEFARYQQSPEFRYTHPDMDVEGFQGIFWLEYIHRVMGRITGLVFLLPLVWFACTRGFGLGYTLRLVTIFLLGAVQGVMGWWMVKSGLVDDPRVSPYRLAAHLGLAFLLFALLFWEALRHFPSRLPPSPSLPPVDLAWATLVALAVQILLGALVAGWDAGLLHNQWPSMEGHWLFGQYVPSDIWFLDPWYINLTEHLPTVQFVHRWYAVLPTVLCVLLGIRLCQEQGYPMLQRAGKAVIFVIVVQYALGVVTLLQQVPLPLASAHQMVALLCWALILFILQRLHAR